MLVCLAPWLWCPSRPGYSMEQSGLLRTVYRYVVSRRAKFILGRKLPLQITSTVPVRSKLSGYRSLDYFFKENSSIIFMFVLRRRLYECRFLGHHDHTFCFFLVVKILARPDALS